MRYSELKEREQIAENAMLRAALREVLAIASVPSTRPLDAMLEIQITAHTALEQALI